MATRNFVLTSLVSATLILGGCATNSGNQDNQATGTAVGAVLGALLGKATGDHDKSRYVWGAIVGAIAGNAIGTYMDKQEAEFRRELSDSGVYVYRDGDNIHLSLPGNITFETGSATITPEFFPVLQDVALVLNKYNKTTLMIAGHTDDTGSAELNQSLSIARANSVKANLVTYQVDPRRITTQGYGEFQPLVPNTSEQNRQQNRRVELTIIPNKKEYR